ncbi:MAG: YfhO family protein [Thermomicrobiales bacterium]|nr:YfhO family protein [Thermomicrobiales bacterium]
MSDPRVPERGASTAIVGSAFAEQSAPRERGAISTTQPWWQTEGLALAVLGIVTLVAIVQVFFRGALMGQDTATQFYPWYDYLGERLRSGSIPGWNPYQFSGAPFAADPQSGWTYLPAMVLFSLFSLPVAIPVFLTLHLVLAGGATYALARLLRLGVSGALVAAIAYELSGPVYGRSVCCAAGFEVATWAPVALVGAELAIQRRDMVGRFVGWFIAGLAISQALAAWLGQGSYYVLLMVGAFIAYRTLLAPEAFASAWRSRISGAFMHGGAVLAIGFGLAAAGILPRLAYIEATNVSGGQYGGASDWASQIGGVTWSMLFHRILDPTLHYPGAAAGALALLALILARGWIGTRFFAGFGIAAMVLAMPIETPLHRLLYLVLPRFEALHQHWPERIAVVAYITAALLAGATIDALERRQPRPRTLAVAAAVPLIIIGVQVLFGVGLPLAAILAVVGAAAIVGLSAVPSFRFVRSAAAPAMILIVTADLLLGFHGVRENAPYGGFHRVDIESYFSATGAVHFLRRSTVDEPARYIGYDPQERVTENGQVVLYRYQFGDQETASLLVNNRATMHGIDDAQGYNPVQPSRYVDLMTALNGSAQEYHGANVFPNGINSPLVDLLNIRYLIVPSVPTDSRPDLDKLAETFPIVYADRKVTIMENPDALPRAWIVHDAQVATPDATLTLLADGSVDPREVVLLETAPPELAPGDGNDAVSVTAQSPDSMRLATSTSADGMLVVSNGYDPGWKAWVDGEQVEVVPADHALQAIPLPAGEHTVTLRYETPGLNLGLAITGTTVLLLIIGWFVIRQRANGRRPDGGATSGRVDARGRRRWLVARRVGA